MDRRPDKYVDTACQYCGTLFRTTVYEVRAGGGKFCSRVCVGKSNHARRLGIAALSLEDHRRNGHAAAIAAREKGVTYTWTQERRAKSAAVVHLAHAAHRAEPRWPRLSRTRIARRAYGRVYAAVKSGRLVRTPCEVCGNVKFVHAHHDDYSKPLDVKWLCRKCHIAHHLSAPLLEVSVA